MATVILSTPIEGVSLLTLNRPKVMNALNLETRQDLSAHFETLDKDDSVKCVVITGGPDVFVAGADLNAFVNLDEAGIAASPNPKYWKVIADFKKPIIAAVNGYALGGGMELAMHCDIIVAGQGAKFGQTELKVGIIPGAGGTQRLTHTVGKFKAMKAVLTADIMSAQDAFDMGLVSEITPDVDVLERAIKLAKKITFMPPLAVRAAKTAILNASELPLSEGLAFEQREFQKLFGSADKTEGMQAFLEKRRPKYEGK